MVVDKLGRQDKVHPSTRTPGRRPSRRAMLMAGVILTLVFTILAPSVGAALIIGPDFLIKLNLADRPRFERAQELGITPLRRERNVFYFRLNGADLARLESARIPYEVVGDDEALRLGLQEPDDSQSGATALSASADDPLPLRYLEPVTAVAGESQAEDPVLDEITRSISEDSLLAYGQFLERLNTRYTFADSNRIAKEYLLGKFRSFGYNLVRSDTFFVSDWSLGFYHGPWGHNIICTKPGVLEPEQMIVLGAHYDSKSMDATEPLDPAPGADRNASGTAAVLEAARVLAGVPTRKTIVFVLFAGGEQYFAGSEFLSRALRRLPGDRVEVMINMDRIGYTLGGLPDINITADQESIAYARLAIQMTFAQTGLKPRLLNEIDPSNWQPFSWNGFRWLDIREGDYNPRAENTVNDRVATLDPEYWADAARVGTATAYTVAASPSAVRGVRAFDVGDGAAVEVHWRPMIGPDVAGYKVYWKSPLDFFQKSKTLTGGDTSTVVTGLHEGAEYTFWVSALTDLGRESAVRSETVLTPQSIPRSPAAVFADVGIHQIDLSWDDPPELDIDHFVIYRGQDSTELSVYVNDWTETEFHDQDMLPRRRYFYRIQSVDRDGNGSELSALTSGIAATFDRGVLIVDVTSGDGLNPPDSVREPFYRDVFGNYINSYYHYDDYSKPLDKSELGAFRVLAWIDDDDVNDRWPADHWAKLNWYLSHKNDFIIAGWQTVRELAVCRTTCQQVAGDFLLDWFDIFEVSALPDVDCAGGEGFANYPDVAFDTAKVLPQWNGNMGFLWGLHPRWPATLTLSYRSATDDLFRTGIPIGVRRGFRDNKLAIMSIPLYYIRRDDARAFMTAVVHSFEQPTLIAGDLDADANATMSDIKYLIDVVYNDLIPIGGFEYVDINGDCEVNVVDVVALIDYILRAGPPPGSGCAE